MSSTLDIAAALGPPLLNVVVAGAAAADVRDVFLAEPGDAVAAQPSDLVLGVSVSGEDDAVRLVQRSAHAGASGVVMRAAFAGSEAVVAAAEDAGATLAAVGDGIPWAHLVWLLRGVIDRPSASASGLPGDVSTDSYNDLFAIADTVAAIVGAPITIEDNRSRVLAYSSGQGQADTARVATIVGRRVPEDVTAHFRARGVFRRLARSDEPFLVPAGPDGTLPRLVVPVRAGGEWLGSIWAIVDGPVDEVTTGELRRAASILAVHLLRLRAQADIVRRSATELIRSALTQYAPERVIGRALPGTGPWRVVALDAPHRADADEHLQVWETVMRRHGWRNAALADLDGDVFAIVGDPVDDAARPGSWPWLYELVHEIDAAGGRGWAAAAGAPATVPELPRSRAEAAELLGLRRRSIVSGPAVTVEGSWALVVVHRVLGAVDLAVPGSPVPVLLAHDAERDTDYLGTLGAWLEYHAEPQRAAEALMIHPNTLRYRMRRLRELVTVDLDDPVVRLGLFLQIEAVRRRDGLIR